MDEFEEEYYFNDTHPCGCCVCCGCTCESWFDDEFELTEEEIQHYDDVCEEYEERKRKQMFEEQEY